MGISTHNVLESLLSIYKGPRAIRLPEYPLENISSNYLGKKDKMSNVYIYIYLSVSPVDWYENLLILTWIFVLLQDSDTIVRVIDFLTVLSKNQVYISIGEYKNIWKKRWLLQEGNERDSISSERWIAIEM